jgi:intracellular sulfur oxidation DsrE/DsrF family protein
MTIPTHLRLKKNKRTLFAFLFFAGILSGTLLAATLTSNAMAKDADTAISKEKTEAQNNNKNADKAPSHHKLVIQVSTDDLRVQQIALNNAINLQKHYGMDNIDIEIVAYGPGLRMLTTNHTLAPRIKSLTFQDIQFSACGNTLHSIEEKTGFAPKLIKGVKIVPAGVARIIELQEQGYSYVRP